MPHRKKMLQTDQDYRPDEGCYLEWLFRGKNEELPTPEVKGDDVWFISVYV